jgi:hypothetical protein
MDINWLASEAKQIHTLFSTMFYSLVLTLVLIGVVINYFKMPMGHVPQFFNLVGRAAVAALILAAFPEIMNSLADLTDQLAREFGHLNNIHLVVSRLGEKLGSFTWSWVSVKDSVLILISYVSFFILYVTVYLADTLFLYTWMMLFIFSPILIAAFTLPATAQATKSLFQSLIEVCAWKVVWAVTASILWSFALSEVNSPKYDIDFLTAILLNLLLAFSVVITPLIVRGLFKSGIHSASASLGGAILGAAAFTPPGMINKTRMMATRAVGAFKEREKPRNTNIPKGIEE